MNRDFNYDIMPLIKERWSARSISTEKIPEEDINAVIEAARYSPSCFNEQPWRYIVANDDHDLLVMRGFLSEKNLLWAGKAPVLMIIIASNVFSLNQKTNKWNQFDAGSSWGFLQLEAWNRGYVTHGMAGFDRKKVRDELNIPSDYDIIAMIAMGKLGDIKDLDKSFHDTEKPNTRKSLESIKLKIDAFK